MKKYRTIKKIIEAFQFDGVHLHPEMSFDMCGAYLRTPNGKLTYMMPGDYIVKMSDGISLTVMAQKDFECYYEPDNNLMDQLKTSEIF